MVACYYLLRDSRHLISSAATYVCHLIPQLSMTYRQPDASIFDLLMRSWTRKRAELTSIHGGVLLLTPRFPSSYLVRCYLRLPFNSPIIDDLPTTRCTHI